MYLYALTLQRAGGILQAVYGARLPSSSDFFLRFVFFYAASCSTTLILSGNFSAPKAQEIAISHGKVLELIRPDPETGKLLTVYSTEIFGLIRCMQPFRLTGALHLRVFLANVSRCKSRLLDPRL